MIKNRIGRKANIRLVAKLRLERRHFYKKIQAENPMTISLYRYQVSQINAAIKAIKGEIKNYDDKQK